MGAAWLTFYFLIDRRRTLGRRLAVALGIALVIFAPETYKPEISYLSHFLGFLFGVLSALIYYFVNRTEIKSAEVYVSILPEPTIDEAPEFIL